MDLNKTLSFYRKAQGLSQIDLADALEVSRQTVSKWETGAALPSAENLLALSKLYGVPVDAILNGTAADGLPPEGLPGLVPPAAEAPAAPPDPTLLPRRKLVLRILALLLPCDLLFFFMDVSLYSGSGFLTFAVLARVLTCCAIGLFFAWQDRRWPAKRRTSLLIAAAALALGLYPHLFSTPLLWRLYDLIVWTGRPLEASFPPNSFRTFIGWTLCDEYAIFAHGLLVTFFQLGRLRFSKRKKVHTLQTQAVHQA